MKPGNTSFSGAALRSPSTRRTSITRPFRSSNINRLTWWLASSPILSHRKPAAHYLKQPDSKSHRLQSFVTSQSLPENQSLRETQHHLESHSLRSRPIPPSQARTSGEFDEFDKTTAQANRVEA